MPGENVPFYSDILYHNFSSLFFIQLEGQPPHGSVPETQGQNLQSESGGLSMWWELPSVPFFLFWNWQSLLTIALIRAIFVDQLLSRIWLFPTPWTAAHQASLSFTISQGFLKLVFIEWVMPSSHLILCRPLLLPTIFPSIRVFSVESALCIMWPKRAIHL